MELRAFTILTTNNWVDLTWRRKYSGVAVDVLVRAITAREVRSITSHPARPGDWMVPLADVDQWWGRRELARTVG
jgi:hypothetical protein